MTDDGHLEAAAQRLGQDALCLGPSKKWVTKAFGDIYSEILTPHANMMQLGHTPMTQTNDTTFPINPDTIEAIMHQQELASFELCEGHVIDENASAEQINANADVFQMVMNDAIDAFFNMVMKINADICSTLTLTKPIFRRACLYEERNRKLYINVNTSKRRRSSIDSATVVTKAEPSNNPEDVVLQSLLQCTVACRVSEEMHPVKFQSRPSINKNEPGSGIFYLMGTVYKHADPSKLPGLIEVTNGAAQIVDGDPTLEDEQNSSLWRGASHYGVHLNNNSAAADNTVGARIKLMSLIDSAALGAIVPSGIRLEVRTAHMIPQGTASAFRCLVGALISATAGRQPLTLDRILEAIFQICGIAGYDGPDASYRNNDKTKRFMYFHVIAVLVRGHKKLESATSASAEEPTPLMAPCDDVPAPTKKAYRAVVRLVPESTVFLGNKKDKCKTHMYWQFMTGLRMLAVLEIPMHINMQLLQPALVEYGAIQDVVHGLEDIVESCITREGANLTDLTTLAEEIREHAMYTPLYDSFLLSHWDTVVARFVWQHFSVTVRRVFIEMGATTMPALLAAKITRDLGVPFDSLIWAQLESAVRSKSDQTLSCHHPLFAMLDAAARDMHFTKAMRQVMFMLTAHVDAVILDFGFVSQFVVFIMEGTTNVVLCPAEATAAYAASLEALSFVATDACVFATGGAGGVAVPCWLCTPGERWQPNASVSDIIDVLIPTAENMSLSAYRAFEPYSSTGEQFPGNRTLVPLAGLTKTPGPPPWGALYDMTDLGKLKYYMFPPWKFRLMCWGPWREASYGRLTTVSCLPIPVASDDVVHMTVKFFLAYFVATNVKSEEGLYICDPEPLQNFLAPGSTPEDHAKRLFLSDRTQPVHEIPGVTKRPMPLDCRGADMTTAGPMTAKVLQTMHQAAVINVTNPASGLLEGATVQSVLCNVAELLGVQVCSPKSIKAAIRDVRHTMFYHFGLQAYCDRLYYRTSADLQYAENQRMRARRTQAERDTYRQSCEELRDGQRALRNQLDSMLAGSSAAIDAIAMAPAGGASAAANHHHSVSTESNAVMAQLRTYGIDMDGHLETVVQHHKTAEKLHDEAQNSFPSL